LLSFLKVYGVSCGIHYPFPLSTQEPYTLARTVPKGVPVASRLSRMILSLPMFPELTRQQILRVAQSVMAFDAQAPSAPGGTRAGLEPAPSRR
jgi:dTDP-4-amino-4,6-dideoxygalactose transaminase